MDFQTLQNYWLERDRKESSMPREELRAAIEEFVQSHNTMALAVGWGDFVRNTPLEYVWYKDAFWIMSEGGLKFVALEHNLKACAAIFEPMGKGGLHGLQVMCNVEFVDPESADYDAFLAYRGIPKQALARMPYPMPMLRVVPVSADFLDSGLKAKGFASRQHYDF